LDFLVVWQGDRGGAYIAFYAPWWCRERNTPRIDDFRLTIADGQQKELPHRFFNRQSAISNRQ
jgi:hypothetical protein